MKSIKNFTVTLLAVGALVSCGSPQASGPSDWTEEAKEVMKTHLHGEVLPFLAKEGLTVTFDATQNGVAISGAKVAGTDLENYAAKYTEELGWVNVSSDYNVKSSAFYAFQKQITLEEGKRFVEVYFYGMDGKNYSTDGDFTLFAYDPYLYEFPSEDVASMVSTYFGGTDVVPEVEADYYMVSARSAAVYCYMDSETEDAGYTAILAEAGWTTNEAKEADGYYYALSPNSQFGVHYLYDEQYGSLDIYLDYALLSAWPATQISAAFAKYQASEFEVPAFVTASSKFIGAEGQSNEMAYNYGLLEYVVYNVVVNNADQTEVATYLTTLESAGWKLVANEDNTQTATKELEEGIATLDLETTQNGGFNIVIHLFLTSYLSEVWPAEDVALLLGNYVTEVVPAYEGENEGFQTFNSFGEKGVQVKLPPEVEAAEGEEAKTQADIAIESYTNTLKTAGWQENGSAGENEPAFLSPNGQINLYIYAFDGYLNIVVSEAPSTSWNQERVNAQLAEIEFTGTLPVPSAENATGYTYNLDVEADSYNIQITYSAEVTDEQVASYQAALVEAGWELLGQDRYGDNWYGLDDGSQVCAYKYGSMLIIDLYGPNAE
ncbi:MAG: hypothetical protein J6M95_04540 [Bacilli bacterium]|nr:hypothetical protein [Bacilli bacterium]